MTNNKKVLVIGSKKHPLADKCVSWGDVFPYLGDYDTVLINLTSLRRNQCDTQMGRKIIGMRSTINEIIWANTNVICITAPTIMWGGLLAGSNPLYSNYYWCPVGLEFTNVYGESFEEEISTGYLSFVKKWSHYYKSCDLTTYSIQKRKNFIPQIRYFLRNKALKLLAFTITFKEWNIVPGDFGAHKEEIIDSNTIEFYPPTTKIPVHDSIDYLLRGVKQIAKPGDFNMPTWCSKIFIGDENTINQQILDNQKGLERISKHIQDLTEKLNKIFPFKQLLTEGGEGASGERLEDIVEKSLQYIGIVVEPGPQGKEDRIIQDPKTQDKIPLEVTGTKRGILDTKLNQLIGRITDERKPKNIHNVGLLIGNHFKDTPLNHYFVGRGNAFEKDRIDKAVACKVGLLTTIDLFKAVNSKLLGNDVTNFTELIFNQNGLITFK